MEHENDADIDEPYVPPAGNTLGGQDDGQSITEQPTLADTAEGQGVLCFWGKGCDSGIVCSVVWCDVIETHQTPQLMSPWEKQYDCTCKKIYHEMTAL